MTPFTQKVIQIIQQIPPGKVMTYGQVAATAGSPRGARQVVRILHSLSKKHQLPWYRIINAKGQISIQDDESAALQKLYLESEGVEVGDNGFVSLERFQFHPLIEEVGPEAF
ncbi:MGMT family protein [Brevibacillus migulae]|uniref:MGMT family protein n=1 Tax=Brevibacillus migulae TaxID=1644114 RepID=UPI00106EEDAA|nr:MGMT family protein [Brevibacillus migulae]